MGITNSQNDHFITVGNMMLPYNIFMYYMDSHLMGSNYENCIPFTHSPSVFSIQFCPYLTQYDLNLLKIPYDNERFQYKEDGSKIWLPNGVIPYVYRIDTLDKVLTNKDSGTIVKTLGTFKCYNPNKTIGGARNWRNESKLYNYPYSMGYLIDGICEPIEILYENCEHNVNNVMVRQALNINADYSLYVEDYKCDNSGLMEQNVASSSRDLPCVSSQYSSWLATNKNQNQATKNASSMNILTNTATGVIGGGLGGPMGMIIGGASGLIGGITNAYNTHQQINATEKDMRRLPNALNSRGSDVIHGMNTTEMTLKLVRYKQKEEFMQKIGDYFAKYGYKQNRIILPNKRNRWYYNYIRTIEVNLLGSGVPKDHLNKIKNIYNNGVTIWHIDRNGVIVGDYSKDNYEV